VSLEAGGKYTVTAQNLAGRATRSFQIQVLRDPQVFQAYQAFTK
jgi:hypothetical protein